MLRKARHCEKDEAAQKNLLKKAIQQGNTEVARIYANNAIRKKNERLNYLRMGARFDAVAAQLDTAVSMGMVSKTMGTVVRGLDTALTANNMEEIARIMDTFEEQVESLGVQTTYMDGAMNGTSALTTPQDQVDNLIQMVADEHGIEVNLDLGSAPRETLRSAAPVEQNEQLTERLNQLRNRPA